MLVSLDEAKNYLRIDYDDEDELINNLIPGAERLCMDVLRTDDPQELANAENARVAVLFTIAYFYEHREEADHHALTLTLRALLFGSRKAGF